MRIGDQVGGGALARPVVESTVEVIEPARDGQPHQLFSWDGGGIHREGYLSAPAAPPPPPDHIAGQPWTREQIEYLALQAAGRPATSQETYTALRDRIAARYRRPGRPGVLARVRWLINVEAAVAMRDTARPEARPEWERLVADLMAEEAPPVPGVLEPDYSAWMPKRATAEEAPRFDLSLIEADGEAWRIFREAEQIAERRLRGGC